MKIVVTGGHLTPALAFIDEVKKHPDVEVVFMGRKYTDEARRVLSFEYEMITRAGIRFLELKTGRLTRELSLKTLLDLLKVPGAFWRACKTLAAERPDKLVSFGGYLAYPAAVAAYGLQIPIFTHEQTIKPGLTNRLIARLAKKIFLAFPETKSRFPTDKSVVVGNPVRRAIFAKNRKSIPIIRDRPLIYITGGSLGSHSINLMIEKILPQLLDKYCVIHQAGGQSGDFARLSQIKNQRYLVREYFYDDEIGAVYGLADLVIGRAGANTIFELIALKKPAILIPLPWSAGGEQQAHAEFLRQRGAAEVFPQSRLPESLVNLIATMLMHKDDYLKNFDRLGHYYQANASQIMVDTILAQS